MNHFFGQNLKSIRLERKLSQAELGKQLHKGQKTIGNWETGYSEPCLEDLIRISHFFAIDIDCLLKQEMKRNISKAMNSHSNSKENEVETEKMPLLIADIKYMLQTTIGKKVATDDEEIAWRDTYIAVLENRVAQMSSRCIPETVIQDLTARILTLQKTVDGLSGSASVVMHKGVNT